jgi:TetR/AcrR family transcriptional regulator, lmrAB and yxaGH operons repressor
MPMKNIVATEATDQDLTLPDTRTRILRAAKYLFRKRGYHATGLNDILEIAKAPKGSMYHHFPNGKEQIGVAVIESITQDLIDLFAQSRARSVQALIAQAGAQLVAVAEKTNYEICAIFSTFVAERRTSPALGEAVEAAYAQMVDNLAQRLMAEGLPKRAAEEKAHVVAALLEGGSLLAQALQSPIPFNAAVKQASLLCAKA